MIDHTKTRMIAVEQLCVGLFVYLDMSWMDHTFTRNSFKITSAEQITEIRRLGLKTIRVNPRLCDGPPLPMPVPGAPVADSALEAPANPAREDFLSHKKNLIQQLSEQQAALVQCERQFGKAISALKSITKNIFARPKESYEAAASLVEQMLETLLTESNIATHLMADRMGVEDMYMHSLNVTVLAMMLGKRLELTPDQLRILGMGCLFHDLGKADVAAGIVNKMDPLSRLEKNALQLHCELGAILGRKFDMPAEVIEIMLQHHEAMDGSGYPKQLRGDEISLLARIVAVVDTYDELVNPVNPQNAYSPYEALSLMFKQMRKTFDPTPFNMFIRCMGVYPPGTLVKLSDGTFGMVVAVNSQAPSRPSVLIYDPGVPKSEAIVLELGKEAALSVATTITAGQLTEAAYDYLSPKKRQVYFSFPTSVKSDS